MRLFVFVILIILPFYTLTQDVSIDNKDVTVEFNYVSKDVQGTFADFKSQIKWDSNNLQNSKIKGSVGAKTIDTGIGLRDRHLKSGSFFDVDEYPRISFESKKIIKTDEGFRAIGEITIKDTTEKMVIDFTFDKNKFIGTSKLYSNDFDMMTNKDREKTRIDIKFVVPVV